VCLGLVVTGKLNHGTTSTGSTVLLNNQIILKANFPSFACELVWFTKVASECEPVPFKGKFYRLHQRGYGLDEVIV
jgi:hypothetical protein